MPETTGDLTVCLTFDFDALSGWACLGPSEPAQMSRGEFSAVAIDRILRLLRRHDVLATFFVPGHTALAYPDQVRAIAADGHEIGHHGWVHENPAELEHTREREIFELGADALDRVAGIRPAVYRSPGAAFSSNTVDVLKEFAVRFDSSLCGSDFHPYYVRSGDRWSTTEPYVFGETTDLVEVPFSWGLDDYPHLEFSEGWSTEQSTPTAVGEIWQGEFDYALAHEPGGVFTLCMHPEVIGRGSRLLMLEGLIRHFTASSGVRFDRIGDFADRWAAANPVDAWLATRPVQAGRSHRTLIDG